MRYTTIIDITELPSIWNNNNTCRLYLWLVMKCGYHDDDRDFIDASFRVMAGQTNLTLSATRNSLAQLIKAGLVSKEEGGFRIKKWVANEAITARKQDNTTKSKEGGTDYQRMMDEQVQNYQRQLLEALKSCGLDELETWLLELKDGRSLRHHRTYIKANKQNAAWLENYIEKRKKQEKTR